MEKTLQLKRAENKRALAAAHKSADETLGQAKEEAVTRAVAKYNRSDELRAYLNQVYVLAYEDIIGKIQNGKLEYEISFRETALDEFKIAKGLEDDVGSKEVEIIVEDRDREVDMMARTE